VEHAERAKPDDISTHFLTTSITQVLDQGGYLKDRNGDQRTGEWEPLKKQQCHFGQETRDKIMLPV
jgi:hypothetical protein